MPDTRAATRSPSALAGLLLLLPALAGAQAAALPSAEKLVAKHVAAIGGEAAVREHAAYRMTGTFELAAAGLRGDMTVVSAAPNRNALTITIPGVGEIRSGFDGTTAWEMNPMSGARLLEGEELARVSEESHFHGSLLRNPPGIASRQTVERTELGGVPCYRVRVSWKSGRESHECYAVDGGLLVALQSTIASPMGKMETTQLLSDYKEFGGVRHATVLRQQMMGAEQLLTITSIEYEGIDESAFTPPAAIRTLIQAKRAGARPGTR